MTAGAATKLQLTIDVPSPLTGTGQALLLDGQDAGLIRCSIVDDNGIVVNEANDLITFEIVSGSLLLLLLLTIEQWEECLCFRLIVG